MSMAMYQETLIQSPIPVKVVLNKSFVEVNQAIVTRAIVVGGKVIDV